MPRSRPAPQALLRDIAAIQAAIQAADTQAGPFPYHERAAMVQRARHLIDRALASGDRATHARAAEAFHAALAVAYPPGFWEQVALLRRGDRQGLEPALRFLEADPWFYRSGYVKAEVLRAVGRLELAPADRTRLEAILLAAVDGRDRREFRHSCRLARRLASPTLAAALTARLAHGDAGVRRRATWMLAALEDTHEAAAACATDRG